MQDYILKGGGVLQDHTARSWVIFHVKDIPRMRRCILTHRVPGSRWNLRRHQTVSYRRHHNMTLCGIVDFIANAHVNSS